jgi:cell division protein FtsL
VATLIGLSLLVASGLFAVVVAHVVLTQNEFRLDRLRQQVASETALNERLRLQAAEEQSPSRIVQQAEQQLGMVVPPSITYLEPVNPATAPPLPPPPVPSPPARSSSPPTTAAHTPAHTSAPTTSVTTAPGKNGLAPTPAVGR